MRVSVAQLSPRKYDSRPFTSFGFLHVEGTEILQQYSDWFEDESLPIKERMHAGDRLLAYALGKPTTFESPEVGEVKQTLIVRWMPPDPNDRSNVIEQEPD